MIEPARSWLRKALLVMALATAPTMSAGPAQAADQAARTEAKEIAVKAIQAMNDKRYSAALELLAQAESKLHAPTHLLLMARCNVELERWVEAHEMYASLLLEVVPDYAPEAFHKAQGQAKGEIKEVLPKVARVRIAAAATGGSPMTVHVDGKEVDAARLAMPIALAAGAHRIEGRAPGAESKVMTVTAAVGVTQDVELSLGAEESTATPAKPPAAPKAEDDEFPAAATTFIVIGGAALVAGTVLGVVTATEASTIKDECVEDVCPLEQEDAADSAKLTGHLSTTMFIVGGVASAVGLTWLAVDLSGSEDSDTGRGRSAVQARIGPTGVMLTGTF